MHYRKLAPLAPPIKYQEYPLVIAPNLLTGGTTSSGNLQAGAWCGDRVSQGEMGGNFGWRNDPVACWKLGRSWAELELT